MKGEKEVVGETIAPSPEMDVAFAAGVSDARKHYDPVTQEALDRHAGKTKLQLIAELEQLRFDYNDLMKRVSYWMRRCNEKVQEAE